MTALLLLSAALAADLGGTFAADPLAPALDGPLFATESTALPSGFEGRLSAVMAWHPLMSYSADGVSAVVGAETTFHASGAFTLGPARLGVRLPGVLLLSADGLDRPRAVAGDPELQLKLSPWASERARAALLIRGSVPLGGEQMWAGAGSPAGGLTLILDAHQDAWTLALNLGVQAQEAELLSLDGSSEGPRLGGQGLARLGLARCGDQRCASVELLGATGLSDLGEDQGTPLEVLASFRQDREDGRGWTLGGGFGLLPGVGAPAARLFIGVGEASPGG